MTHETLQCALNLELCGEELAETPSPVVSCASYCFPHNAILGRVSSPLPLSFHLTTTTATMTFSVSQQHSQQATRDSVYILVSSFYGPGAVGCWLLVTCALIVAWTINPRQSRVDQITNDFVAVLSFPFIAAVHLNFLLSRLPAPIFEVFTSQNTSMLQLVAAITAPFNIC